MLTKAARAGGALAQYHVGRAYLRGEVVPTSRAEALLWLERAARAGLPEAQHFLAALAIQGLNRTVRSDLFGAQSELLALAELAPDYQAARFWAEQAADGGSAEAKALLACIYNFGPAGWRDQAAALALNQAAAAADCAQGRLGLATVLIERGTPEDLREARRELVAACASGLSAAHLMLGSLEVEAEVAVAHFKIAAEAGLPAGKLRYGLALLEGRGVARDPVAAEGWLRRAGLEGEAAAACAVAELYCGADGIPPNLAEAGIWLRCAAELGDAGAARRLGIMCLRQGDPAEASNWLRRAAELGCDPARLDLAQLELQGGAAASGDLRAWLAARRDASDGLAGFNLGVCYAEGLAGARDDTAARECFRVAADSIPAARYWLGRLMAEGRGGDQDMAAGRAWLEQAASDGVVEAQLLAAEMMVNARGGPRDVWGGHELFSRAAACGNAGALFSLGVMTAGGHGIPADPAAALGFFREAARLGHPRAALMVGRYLAHGIGTEANRAEAGSWLRRARRAFRDEAEAELARLRVA
jgi:TPR repeat protein